MAQRSRFVGVSLLQKEHEGYGDGKAFGKKVKLLAACGP